MQTGAFASDAGTSMSSCAMVLCFFVFSSVMSASVVVANMEILNEDLPVQRPVYRREVDGCYVPCISVSADPGKLSRIVKNLIRYLIRPRLKNFRDRRTSQLKV
eukprot:g65621.t1